MRSSPGKLTPVFQTATVAAYRFVELWLAGGKKGKRLRGQAVIDEVVSAVQLSQHARIRAQQRCFRAEDVEYVLDHGLRLRRTGIEFCVLRHRDVPPSDRRGAGQLIGTVVLLGNDGVAVTMYRNRRALAEIRRRPKWSRSRQVRRVA